MVNYRPLTVAAQSKARNIFAQTPGSWVRIPLEAWMSDRISSLFVLSCVRGGFVTGLIPRPRSPTDYLYD
jgi:hypothetical protein